jgi:hypothetical protein
MKVASLAATAALLAGCAAELPGWRAETVPVVVVHSAPASAAKSPPRCPPLDPAIEAEMRRLTPMNKAKELDGLAAALMGSEATKNAQLRQVAMAYERCRQARN